MKKQTQKKLTEKFKEGRKRINSNNYGITLIALVITVIVYRVFYDKNIIVITKAIKVIPLLAFKDFFVLFIISISPPLAYRI